MRLLSYWILPVISGVVWLGMLLTMLLYWIIHENSRLYDSMGEGQTIAYISDVGADTLKPLFIAGCAVTAVCFDLAFLADRWLRHRGRLIPNATLTEKVLNGLTLFFAVVGTAGLILLAVFDTRRHPQLHRLFLLLFILGYILSAVFICWEYQRLGRYYREHRILALSFWVKLAFILIEFALAVAFGTLTGTSQFNVAAILEWVIALIFSFYVFSFVMDLWPAVHTKSRSMRFSKPAAPGMPLPHRVGTRGGAEGVEYGSGSSERELEEGPGPSVYPNGRGPAHAGRNF